MLYSRLDDKRHGNFHPYIIHRQKKKKRGKKVNFRSNIKPNPWRTRAKKIFFSRIFQQVFEFFCFLLFLNEVGGIEEKDETFHKKKFVSMVKEEFFWGGVSGGLKARLDRRLLIFWEDNIIHLRFFRLLFIIFFLVFFFRHSSSVFCFFPPTVPAAPRFYLFAD